MLGSHQSYPLSPWLVRKSRKEPSLYRTVKPDVSYENGMLFGEKTGSSVTRTQKERGERGNQREGINFKHVFRVLLAY